MKQRCTRQHRKVQSGSNLTLLTGVAPVEEDAYENYEITSTTARFDASHGYYASSGVKAENVGVSY